MSKPRIPVINWENPLTRGLVWNATPGKNTSVELVNKKPGSLDTSGSWAGQSLLGDALGSTSTSNGGAFWPWTNNLTSITGTFSIIVYVKLTAVVAFSHFLDVPYHSTWSSPFSSLRIGCANDTTKLEVSRAVSGTLFNGVSTVNLVSTSDNLTFFGTASTGGTHRLFKNGLFQESVSDGGGANIDFGDKVQVHLLNRASADLGEGTSGVMPFAAIWNRKLTDDEMRRIYTDPWQLYKQPGLLNLNS